MRRPWPILNETSETLHGATRRCVSERDGDYKTEKERFRPYSLLQTHAHTHTRAGAAQQVYGKAIGHALGEFGEKHRRNSTNAFDKLRIIQSAIRETSSSSPFLQSYLYTYTHVHICAHGRRATTSFAAVVSPC